MREESLPEVLTVEEVATYLKVSKKTILRMAQAGEIPSMKVSGQWRFFRTYLNEWLAAHLKGRESPASGDLHESFAPLTRLLRPEHVIENLKPGSKEEVLRQLAAPLVRDGIVADEDRYVENLLARESVVSTAVGRGIALPHVRRPEEAGVSRTCVVAGLCPEGTDFASLDGKPTFLFALCCSRNDAGHLRLITRMSLILRYVDIDRLRRGKTDRRRILESLLRADARIVPLLVTASCSRRSVPDGHEPLA